MAFKFDKGRRQMLSMILKRYPHDQIQEFICLCEGIIKIWQDDWPAAKAISSKESKRRLANLSAKLSKVRHEIMLLPEATSRELWSRWKGNAKSDFLLKILTVEQEASTLADDLSRPGGVKKNRERDLVIEIVSLYVAIFGQKPSINQDGIFMTFLGAIEEQITLPDEGKITLGRDIVSDSIERYLQQQRWEKNMYEFRS